MQFSALSSPRSDSNVSFNPACKASASRRTAMMAGLRFQRVERVERVAIKQVGFEFQGVEQKYCGFLPLPNGALEHLRQVIVFIIAFREQDVLCRELFPVPCSIIVSLA